MKACNDEVWILDETHGLGIRIEQELTAGVDPAPDGDAIAYRLTAHLQPVERVETEAGWMERPGELGVPYAVAVKRTTWNPITRRQLIDKLAEAWRSGRGPRPEESAE